MNKRTTIEGNKLIAEFVQFKQYGFDGSEYLDEDNLLYHSSWDWLIPVVNKILNMINTEFDVSFSSSQNSIKSALLRLDIDYLFVEVVKFIKLYNKNLVR